MLAISRFVLRHKGAVVVFWLAALVAGGAASAKLSSRLSPQFALPGAASYQANQQIPRLYGNGGNGNPELAVVRLPPGQNGAGPAVRQALGRAFAAVTTRVGAVRVADATIVRALLVPALIAILGKWNWWLPRPARHLLRVPAAAPPARAASHATAWHLTTEPAHGEPGSHE